MCSNSPGAAGTAGVPVQRAAREARAGEPAGGEDQGRGWSSSKEFSNSGYPMVEYI